MLCSWRNFKGVLHFELVPHGRVINFNIFLVKNWTEFMLFWKRNTMVWLIRTKPRQAIHRSKLTKNKLSVLQGVNFLLYPTYSPDIATSDNYLFRSMAHILKGRLFNNYEEVKAGCNEFFASKLKECYQISKQIPLLTERWAMGL